MNQVAAFENEVPLAKLPYKFDSRLTVNFTTK